MTETLLPDLCTAVTPAQVYAALRDACAPVLGTSLARESLLVLLSQWACETARGKAMHRFNLGNIKHVPGDGHDYSQFRCDEIIGGKTVWFDPPNPGCSFRAYATLDAGAVDYLTLLHKHFAGAWPDVVKGDTLDFAKDLYAEHYFTASPALYAASLHGLYAEFDRTVPHDVVAPAPPLPMIQVAAIEDIGQPTPPGDLEPAADA